MDKKVFGSFIKEKRIEKNLTQKELANNLMVDVTAVSKWERGVSYPDITLIPDICKYLEVSEKELIESSNDTEYRYIKSEAQKYKKIKDVLFYSFSVCYIIAVLTCFIVNLAVNRTLSWFFPVLSGCLCGFCFVPGVTRFFQKGRLLIYIGSTLLSLIALFVTCSIYTSNFWCFVAASATALGYFVICCPIIVARQRACYLEGDYQKIKRFFLIFYMTIIYLLTALMLVFISAYTKASLGFSIKILTGCFWILLLFGIVRMLKLRLFTRLGIDFALTALYCFFLNGFLNHMLNPSCKGCYIINFADWDNCSNGNVCLIIVISALFLSALFFAVSILKRKRCRKTV